MLKARDYFGPVGSNNAKWLPTDILGGNDTLGNTYYVMPSTETWYTEFLGTHQITHSDGTQSVKSTVVLGMAAATSNRHDVIKLSAYSAHAQSTMITVAKNRLHFQGMDMSSRSYGLRTRITLDGEGAATDLAVMVNTGVGNTFSNIKFDSASDVAESLYGVIEAGEYGEYNNCEFYKSDDLDNTGAAEFVSNGDSTYVHDCTIGSNANAISGAVIRPCILVTAGIVTGKVSRDVTFENCNLWRKFGNAANRFVYGANAADVERMMLFDRCRFWGAKLSTAIPAQNVAFGASLTVGDVLLDHCISVHAATAMSTTTGVWVNGPNQTTAAGGAEIGIALQAS